MREKRIFGIGFGLPPAPRCRLRGELKRTISGLVWQSENVLLARKKVKLLLKSVGLFNEVVTAWTARVRG